MGVSTKTVEEACCDVCKHTWIIHEGGSRDCPECKRRASTITRGWKRRHLCIPCHTVWLADYRSEEELECPKCKSHNEGGTAKNIVTDVVNSYSCGSCGNTWIRDDIADPREYVPVCNKCGCGQEEAWSAEIAKHFKAKPRYSVVWSSYRGHAQKRNPDTGEMEPSKEEIDARIATGIWKEHIPPRPTWHVTL